MSADRNLLIGVLALQLDFITREQLIEGMQSWILAKSKSLAEILEASGALASSDRQLLEPLVERHISQHNDDPQMSLAALRSIGDTMAEQLFSLADDDIAGTLSFVGSAKRGEADSTLSVGSSTTEGARFRVLRFHAAGGLGQVSVARDSELNREVALKEIKESYADVASARERFMLEAEVTGGLEHPGIVPVYGLGAFPDGRPYYAMRFIKGDSLKQAIARHHDPERVKKQSSTDRRLELRQLLGRFVDVCQAMEYAHSRGVLHRDLKPGNIMLGKYGETLVVDWGLAKAQGECDDVQSELPLKPSSGSSVEATEMGQMIGTPQYMSPEQAKGQLDKLGPAADVFSLGACLFHLLTGKMPYEDVPVEQLVTHVQEARFPKVRQVAKQVPKALEAICLKAMAAKPGARYMSAKELLSDVERFLADEPVTAHREPVSVRMRRWGRKHPALVSGGLATVLVTVIGLLIGNIVLGQKNRELAEKEAIATAVKEFLLYDMLQLAEAEEQADAGIQVDPALRVRIALERGSEKLTAGYLDDQPTAKAELKTWLAEGLRGVDPELTVRTTVLNASKRVADRFLDQPTVDVQVRITLGVTLVGIGEFLPAIEQFEQAQLICDSLYGPIHPKTLSCRHMLGSAYLDAGRFDEALLLLQQTFETRRETMGAMHPDTISTMSGLANAFVKIGRPEESLPLYEQTLRSRQTESGPNSPEAIRATSNLAVAYLNVGRHAEAIPLLEKAVDLQQAILGPEHPETFVSRSNLAVAFRLVGRLDEAISILEETLKLEQAALGPEHPRTLRTMSDLANAYRHAFRSEEAIPLIEYTLEVRSARLGAEQIDTIQSMDQLASLYIDVYRMDEGVRLHQQALKLCQAKLGADNPRTLAAMNNLAVGYSSAGQLDDAILLFERVLKAKKGSLGEEHPSTIKSMIVLADAYHDAKRPDKSILLLEQAAELQQAKLGSEHVDAFQTMQILAITYADAGRLEASLSLFEQVLNLRQSSLGSEHPDTIMTLGLVAIAELQLERFGAAETHLLEGHAAAAQLPEPSRQRLRRAFVARLGELYRAWNKPDDAAKWEQKLNSL